MLSGKLAIERADNGWIMSWWEKRSSLVATVEEHREVFDDAGQFLARVSQLVGIAILVDSDGRFVGDFAKHDETHGSANPAIDPDVADLMPEGAPQSAYVE